MKIILLFVLASFFFVSGMSLAQTIDPAPADEPVPKSEPAPAGDPAPAEEPDEPANAPAPAPSAEGGSAEPAPVAEQTLTVTDGLYKAVCKSGNAPFKEKTKVSFQKSGDSYSILDQIRGAIEGEKGIWFYWYDAGGNTLSAFFKMDESKSSLASEINSAVTAHANRPRDQEAEYKARYQSYEQEAIKQAE
ncbi:MAG: hypothetical protein HYU99_01645 [Deltaproteobacteria bacterium]|nr:hypothetical protein [Deltaproteobacteria bacterium]